ncbi:hypothetical protein PGT21_030874 [Puccinia graminis f. sp. tritici]|uniref:Uncharacterized protein n=1 Tax=Puccinia graminis f. sp. tritici TaxID=56615 RepID=A0A5B0LQ18_PUCGR|nr:hypothetical protein PGT21_030874 [Puccinia graminis f. sp. tritici]KAA1081940.1 hypothetical protein PGTUg99_029647 [Puccinia graminis f. sp. tritici]
MPTVFSLRRTYRATATRRSFTHLLHSTYRAYDEDSYEARRPGIETQYAGAICPFKINCGPSSSRKQPIANEGGDYNPLYNGRVMPNQRSLVVVFDSNR